jgi:hypothetical protein
MSTSVTELLVLYGGKVAARPPPTNLVSEWAFRSLSVTQPATSDGGEERHVESRPIDDVKRNSARVFPEPQSIGHTATERFNVSVTVSKN